MCSVKRERIKMDFFKVNLEFMKILQNLSKVEIVVLFRLASMMTFKNDVMWEKDLQEVLSFDLNINRHTLQNIISRLIKKGVLKRKGFYIVVEENYLKKGR